MIKKSILYPKTERMAELGDCVRITEKLDGSNLTFYKKDGELWIGMRKNIFNLSSLDEVKDLLYKDLYNWLKKYGQALEEDLHEGSAICGEWIAMGVTNYPKETWTKKWYMFAKANITEEERLVNICHDHELFIYPFEDKTIPEFLGVVPEVGTIQELPTKAIMDNIYEDYTKKVRRPVEGFVMNYRGIITKYVRMKKGQVVEYSQDDRKGSIS